MKEGIGLPSETEGAVRSGGTMGGDPEAVRVWLLGGFRVRVGARLIEGDSWRNRKAASLIKLLALAPGHRLHNERAMDLLWPELDSKMAANNLRQVLHVALRIIEPRDAAAAASRHLQRRSEQLALCPDGQLWVDVEAFEQAATAARRARNPGSYKAALNLYTGELLPGDLFEAWAEVRREDLRMTYLSLIVELAVLYKKRGEYGSAIETLGRAVVEEPANEDAHAGLMRLYALSGQHRKALAQYERLRELLQRELGTRPGPTTQRLHEQIAAGTNPPPPSHSPE